MSDIRAWLGGLGLGEYAAMFEAEKVTVNTLPELTDSELKELGLPLGPRKALLKAVREGAADLGASSAPAETAPPSAERRQISVMFCDLVGSTALSEKLDPEDLRSVMQAYRQTCGTVIERYQGHVAQYLGDGLMAYFGWPSAHEDDADRAIRAGLDIVEAIETVAAPEPLAVRIGIASGVVVVGDSGEAQADARLAVGDTPNLAARIQALAATNSVAIGHQTRRLAGGAFALTSLGEQALKGVAEPVEIFQVVEAKSESRFEARAAAGLTPFVGREHEIGLLLDRWEQVKDGEGQVVLLSGEPGIGKSRISAMLEARLADEPHTRLRSQCSPHYASSPYYPFIAQLERAAGFAREDSAEAKLDKLEAALSQGTDDVAAQAPLLASMLSLPLSRYAPLALLPQEQKALTIAALAQQVVGLARQQPVSIILEDAHWIDPTTLEAFGAIIEHIERAPVLLVITHRPEFSPPWSGCAYLTMISLARLSQRQGQAMVQKVTHGKSLPGEVLDQIVARTDGVPLFVEELTKTILEAGFLKDEDGRYALDGPLPPLAIPATLQDSLTARLDRLGSVKEVAQVGACIGREFAYELMAAITPLDDSALEDALQQLVVAELVFRRGTPPDATYTFKHALVQEVAYSSLLKQRRQQLHREIANVVVSEFPLEAEREPEALARHFQEGGLIDRAIEHWMRAGRSAAARYANYEALTYFENALDLIRQHTEPAAGALSELEARLAMGSAFISTKGLFSEEVLANYSRARELSERVGSPRQRFGALFGEWMHTVNCPDIPGAGALADELLALSQQEEDPDIDMQAHHARWTTDFLGGDLHRVVTHVTAGQSIYDVERHRDHKFTYGGHDPGACSLSMGALALWQLGHAEQSLQSIREALDLAQRLGHPFSLALTYFFAAQLHHFRREPKLVVAMAQDSIAVSEEHKLPLWSLARPIVGWGQVIDGDGEAGLAAMHKSLGAGKALGTEAFRPFLMTLLADAHARSGASDLAIDVIDEALELTARGRANSWDEEMLRAKGEFLLAAGGQIGEAEDCLWRALRTAAARDAKGWELRAATSLARLWQSQGRTAQARDLLAPVYDWFSEGFDTPDLMDAKALLDALN